MFKFIKFVFSVLVIAALLIGGYQYFHLDQNQAFQNFIKTGDIKSAETVYKPLIAEFTQTISQ